MSADQAPNFINQIRANERFEYGRRIVCLVVIGVLAKNDVRLKDLWRTFDFSIKNHDRTYPPEGILSQIADALDRDIFPSDQYFGRFIVPDIVSVEYNHDLIFPVSRELIEFFSRKPVAEMGSWFDRIIDEISLGRRSAEVTTPRNLATLMAELSGVEDGDTVLDPTCGLGGTLSAALARAPNARFQGQEISPMAAAIASLRLRLLGKLGSVEIYDILGSFHRNAKNTQFDCILCDPPIGIDLRHHGIGRNFDRYTDVSSRRAEPVFVQYCINHLKADGRAVILLPAGFLFRSGGEAKYRENLLKQGLVEGVISLPTGIVPWTEFPLAILVLRRNTSDQPKVRMVDASYLRYSSKKPSDRLDHQAVKDLVDLYHGGEDGDKSRTVSVAELIENNSNIQPRLWISAEENRPVDFTNLIRAISEAELKLSNATDELDSLYSSSLIREIFSRR